MFGHCSASCSGWLAYLPACRSVHQAEAGSYVLTLGVLSGVGVMTCPAGVLADEMVSAACTTVWIVFESVGLLSSCNVVT
jgi:hypothetical protein